MTDLVRFEIQEKTASGKATAKSVRKKGMLPCVIYGGSALPQMFVMSLNKFNTEYQKGGIKTRMAELVLGDKVLSAIVKDVQKHRVTDMPLHVDFLRVDQNTSVKLALTIKLVGEEKSIGLKKGGLANIVSRTVEFFCHPSSIPHHIEVNIGDLDIGDIVHINDIPLPAGVVPVDKTNFTVVSMIGRVDESEAKGA